MNNVSSFESDEDVERKVKSIMLGHLYLEKRGRHDKVSLIELQDRVSAMDKAYINIDLVKLWNDSDLVKITDNNEFSITEKGMAEEEKRIKENRIIE